MNLINLNHYFFIFLLSCHSKVRFRWSSLQKQSTHFQQLTSSKLLKYLKHDQPRNLFEKQEFIGRNIDFELNAVSKTKSFKKISRVDFNNISLPKQGDEIKNQNGVITNNIKCSQLKFQFVGSYNNFLKLVVVMIQLQSLINQLQKDGNHLRALKQAKKNCSFEEAQLKILTPSSVFLFIEKLNNKTYILSEGQSQGNISGQNIWSNHWHPNEYKHFVWLTLGYFYVKNTSITSFGQQDIDFFSKVFPQKERAFLQYHLLALIKQNKSKREVWSKQETELLYELMNSEKYKGKWSDISYRLYFHSNRTYFKSSHKCREMWFNHLNPNVSHQKWTLSEDIVLFKLVAKLGTKWAQISKAMEGVRTEHMVKNRFNSLIKKYSLKYQRYSLKKLAEIIQKDLEAKLQQTNQGCQSSKDANKQDEQMSDDIKIEKEEGKQEIIFIQAQKIDQNKKEEIPNVTSNTPQQSLYEQASKAEQNKVDKSVPLEQHPTENTLIIPEPRIQGPTQREETTKNLENYELDYENMNNMQNEGEVIHMEWTVMYKVHQVELIDYLGVDYEFKPTIFSGTN